MNRYPLIRGVAAVILLVAALDAQTQEQQVNHARRVLDLMREERFDEVVKEFNAQMVAALSTSQVRDVWASLRQQVGPFAWILDERVTTPAAGVTAVTLGCQFEKTALNVIIAFDSENKIAGLRMVPRPSSTREPTSPPTSSRFKEELVTVGNGEWALPGTLSLPTGRILAAVVLVHGSGPNDRDETIGPNKPLRDIAWGLADRGIAVLRYEKRTRQHGAKMAAAIKSFTVREETTADAVLAAELLRSRKRSIRSGFSSSATAWAEHWLPGLRVRTRPSPASSSWPALHGHFWTWLKSYPTLNHLFMSGEGKATPADYQRPGKVEDFVLDDIAEWIGKL